MKHHSISTSIPILLLCLVLIAAVGCEKQDDGDNGDGSTESLDDCGYPVVSVPQGCDACHGAPPDTGRHPPNHRCFRCHGAVIGPDMQWTEASLHQNGTVDVAVGCASCHGWNQGTSPPQDLTGSCDPDARGVGAHMAMRRSAIPAHQVNCTNCHTVPLAVWEVGHIDGDNRAEVRFKNLATADGAQPSWDGNTCSNVYCHGGTLEGGWLTDPSWTDDSGRPSRCGACHWIMSPDGDAEADCSACHPTSVDADRRILPSGTHINGTVDLAVQGEKGVK